MTNKEFITALADKLGKSQREITQLTEILLSAMIKELENENTISVQGFGSFEVKKKAERISVHPVTQQRMLVPPKLVLGFKPSNVLKEKFK